MTWRNDAAAATPCAPGCPAAGGIPSHSDECRNQRDLALAFLARIVATERERALQPARAALNATCGEMSAGAYLTLNAALENGDAR